MKFSKKKIVVEFYFVRLGWVSKWFSFEFCWFENGRAGVRILLAKWFSK